jgi:transcription elongation factor GreA
MAKTPMTSRGAELLRAELHRLKTIERPATSQSIAEARAQGDLSENAEYDAAKEAQGHLEARIARLEETIGNARVVDESAVDASRVRILSIVRVKNHKVDKEQTYTLVAAEEADFAAGKISIDSPIGRGLLGKEVGDAIEIKVPAGRVKLEILEISR